MRKNRCEILEICARYGASNVRVFGSVARGEERPESDVDLLVTLCPGTGLIRLSGLMSELEIIARRPVEILTEGALANSPRDSILGDAVLL